MLGAEFKIDRRGAIQRLGAGTLLAMGLWPGALRAQTGSPGRSFRFIVVNDTHYLGADCGAWLEGVISRMKKENAEFCLHAGDLTEKGERGHLETVKELFAVLGAPAYPVI